MTEYIQDMLPGMENIQWCACDCGEITPLARKTRRERGEMAGQPLEYKRNHKPYKHQPIIERFWVRVNKTDTCWLWTGTKTPDGYPKLYVGYGRDESMYVLAHRYSYEQFVGPIPSGLTIDHVKARGCTTKLCVNPDHLEAVTNVENVMRGNGICVRHKNQTHCIHDHPFDDENTVYSKNGKQRSCLACRKTSNARRMNV